MFETVFRFYDRRFAEFQSGTSREARWLHLMNAGTTNALHDVWSEAWINIWINIYDQRNLVKHLIVIYTEKTIFPFSVYVRLLKLNENAMQKSKEATLYSVSLWTCCDMTKLTNLWSDLSDQKRHKATLDYIQRSLFGSC